jgi:sugar O-acyltransferase (sialic acid O-acetyltransferase NeuD family)
LEIIEALNTGGRRYECLGFLDDDEQRWGTDISGIRILGPLALAREFPGAKLVHAIGSPKNFRVRLAIAERLQLEVDRFETLVHPSAVVSHRCQLGRGVIVCPNVFLGPRSRIGDGVTILANAVVNHDADIGAWTLIASGAIVSGGVRVEAACYLGAGVVLKEGIHIGSGALVGMGAVVIRNVPPQSVVAGNPARAIDATASVSRVPP